mgnify:CR=1 FL=1|jgi:hypothetical protein
MREFIGGAALAKEVLHEIPEQLTSFMAKHGITPNPPLELESEGSSYYVSPARAAAAAAASRGGARGGGGGGSASKVVVVEPPVASAPPPPPPSGEAVAVAVAVAIHRATSAEGNALFAQAIDARIVR